MKTRILSICVVVVTLFATAPTVQGKISMPAIFSNHMVLQQGATIEFWGWGKPCEWVKVVASWSPEDTILTRVPSSAIWQVELITPVAGGTHTISIIEMGVQTIIEDVLIGDVWLCGGQSNMEWQPCYTIKRGEEARTKADVPDLRFFHVEWRPAPYPQEDVHGQWLKCSPETMWKFSAIAYFFGRKIHDEIHIPVGLISSNWGGSPIEAWIPESYINKDKYLSNAAARLGYFEWAPSETASLYNGMIAPLIPLSLKGVLWYQGESNVENSYAYTQMLEGLAKTWRDGFGDFDFYYAQIAPFGDRNFTDNAEVRDAQRRAHAKIDKSCMVVMSDIGDTTDIHPRNKDWQGERFAHAALNLTYGKSEFAAHGPLFSSFEQNGNKVLVNFNHAEQLNCSGNGLSLFEVEDENGKWHFVSAKIIGPKIELSINGIATVKNVRFAWNNTSTPGIFNEKGLPTSCFNTADWMKRNFTIMPWER